MNDDDPYRSTDVAAMAPARAGDPFDYAQHGSSESDDAVADDRDTIVSLKNVHKTYLLGVEGVPALRGVSATVRRGEFVAVYGTSGGGKTSLLNIIGTIDRPTKGEVIIGGLRVNSSTSDKDLANIRLNRLGFVFQTFNLLSSLKAIDNVMLPMILKGVLSPSERRARALRVLEQVGMGHRVNHFPPMLSGGEQQRVTIARAIANQPDMLLLDEPTGDLDLVSSNNVMRLLLDLNIDEGITLIMVTHDVNLKAFADRVIWMRDGKISKVEITDPRVKADAIARLDADVAAAAASGAAAASSTAAASVMAPEKPAEIVYANTTVRMPSDYAALRAVTSAAGRKALGKRLALAGVKDPGLGLAPGAAAPTSVSASAAAAAAASSGPNSSADGPVFVDASSAYSFYTEEEEEDTGAGVGLGRIPAAAATESDESSTESLTAKAAAQYQAMMSERRAHAAAQASSCS